MPQQLLNDFGTRGHERGRFLIHLAWELLVKTSTMTVAQAGIQQRINEFCYDSVATALSNLVKPSIQLLILALSEDQRTDEAIAAICKEFEHEIITLACFRSLARWPKKEIHAELMSFLDVLDKKDF